MRPRALLALAIATALCAQEKPAFEAASVKVSPPSDGRFSVDISPGGRLTLRNNTLWILIRQAYGLRDGQIVGGPAWIKTEGFDIDAKPQGDAPVSRPEVLKMLQTLIEGRFLLKSHRETRDQPGYELVLDKGGAKLTPPGEGPSNLRSGDLDDPKMTLESLCQILEFDVSRPVVNKTGLAGPYAIKLQWASDRAAPSRAAENAAFPSLFTAVRESLGLKLQPGPVAIEVMVIDSASRPSAN